MTRRILIVVVLLLAAFAPRPRRQADFRVASKMFTESVILSEMFRILAEDSGQATQHLRELGGTRLVFDALQNGEVDIYPEYTGTLLKEIFADRGLQSDDELRRELARHGIGMSESLGFNNRYALGMLQSRADELDIDRISDLNRASDLRFGFSSEFQERADDGWHGLQQVYSLNPQAVSGMDHDIAYRQLQLGQIDVVDVYTTDARIAAMNIAVLEDDRQYFPRYDAVVLYREQSKAQHAEAIKAILQLTGRISERAMIELNRKVELNGESEASAAAEFVRQSLNVGSTTRTTGFAERITATTFDHLELVRRSLLPAILIGIPLGIAAARGVWIGHLILGVTGIFQTIPALALLVVLLPIVAALGLNSVGAGAATAIVALFLYSLLPIVRNTHAGLTSIDPALMESAEVLNLPRWYRLVEIELPLASRSILAGIKTAAVMNIGFATLGALVGAGGYGQPILSGIRLANTRLILEGAIPAAVLALVAQAAFEVIERLAVPRGLRTTAAR